MLAVNMSKLFLFAAVAALPAATLPVIPGDSTRGAKLFESERCIQCHAVNGRGGKVGVDLGRSVPRNYTPAYLASTMWNHAPVMWAAMEGARMEKPKLDAGGRRRSFRLLLLVALLRKAGRRASAAARASTPSTAACATA